MLMGWINLASELELMILRAEEVGRGEDLLDPLNNSPITVPPGARAMRPGAGGMHYWNRVNDGEEGKLRVRVGGIAPTA